MRALGDLPDTLRDEVRQMGLRKYRKLLEYASIMSITCSSRSRILLKLQAAGCSEELCDFILTQLRRGPREALMEGYAESEAFIEPDFKEPPSLFEVLSRAALAASIMFLIYTIGVLISATNNTAMAVLWSPALWIGGAVAVCILAWAAAEVCDIVADWRGRRR